MDKKNKETLNYYDENAKAYSESTLKADMSFSINKFLSFVKDGGKILDAGCGSGRDSKVFIQKGYETVSMDASFNMCREAEKLLNREVLCLSFQDMEFENEFDAVWCSASLLHVPDTEMDLAIDNIFRALKKDGILYVSFKYGKETYEKDGRYFFDYDEEGVENLLKKHSFEILETYVSSDVREERAGEKWVNCIARKI